MNLCTDMSWPTAEGLTHTTDWGYEPFMYPSTAWCLLCMDPCDISPCLECANFFDPYQDQRDELLRDIAQSCQSLPVYNDMLATQGSSDRHGRCEYWIDIDTLEF